MSARFQAIAPACVIISVLTACASAEGTVVAELPTETPSVVPSLTVTPDPCPHEVVVEAYHDVNENNQRDPAEQPLEGIEFGLLMSNVPANRALIAHGPTGPDGRISLSSDQPGCLAPDTTILPVRSPAGYHMTRREGVDVSEVAASGQPALFGFVIVPVTPRPTSTPITPLGDKAPRLAPFGPCDLVTESEVEDATGITVPQTPEAFITNIGVGDGDRYVCDYSPAATITTSLPAPTDDIGNLLQILVYGDPEDITGLGDRAYWMTDFRNLVVLRRNVLLEVRLDGSQPADLDTARALALIALPRLDDLLDHPDRPAATDAPRIDACNVLAVTQAEEILGPLTGDPKLESAIGEMVGIVYWCTYPASPNSATVQFTRFGSPAKAVEAFNNSRPAEGIAPGDVVTGIGDKAAVGDDQWSLLILRDTVVISIQILGDDEASARDQAIAIGKIVVVRIP